MKEGTPWEDVIILKFYDALVLHNFYMCVYPKGMRDFDTVHWEGHNSDIWDLFFVYFKHSYRIYRQVLKGGACHLCLKTFLVLEEWKLWMGDFCCAGCRKQTLKSNTSCCYMFEKTHMISRDVTGHVLSCMTTWRGETITKNITLGESDTYVRWNILGAPRHT